MQMFSQISGGKSGIGIAFVQETGELEPEGCNANRSGYKSTGAYYGVYGL
jgi:hypothetical protein